MNAPQGAVCHQYARTPHAVQSGLLSQALYRQPPGDDFAPTNRNAVTIA